MADSGATPAEVGDASSGTVSSAEDGGVASAVEASPTEVTKDPVPEVSGIFIREIPSVRPSILPMKRIMTDIGGTHENGGLVSSGQVASAKVMDDVQFYAEVTEDTAANCNGTLSKNLSSVGSVMHMDIASKGVLQKLEEIMARLSEDLIPLMEFVKTKMQEEMDVESLQAEASAEGTHLEGDQETEEHEKIMVRNRCIEAIMSITEILENNEDKTLQVKGWYEKIYDTAPETSYILRILEKYRRVKILIDCDSDHIGRLINRVVNHDGDKVNGTELPAFADVMDRKVYAAGKPKKWNNGHGDVDSHPIAVLGECLLQLAMRVVFRNKGCPYEFDNEMMEHAYVKIVAEALEEESSALNLSYSCQRVCSLQSAFGREVAVISLVPGILVEKGFKDGILTLNEHLTYLLLYFNGHVLPKMKDYLWE